MYTNLNDKKLRVCSVCGLNEEETKFHAGITNHCAKCWNARSNNYHSDDLQNRVDTAMKSQERRAGGLTSEDNLTVADVERKYEYQFHLCAKCFEVLKEYKDFHIAHKISVKNGGHLNYNNMELLCPKCNREFGSKNDESLGLFFALGNLVKWLFSGNGKKEESKVESLPLNNKYKEILANNLKK